MVQLLNIFETFCPVNEVSLRNARLEAKEQGDLSLVRNSVLVISLLVTSVHSSEL